MRHPKLHTGYFPDHTDTFPVYCLHLMIVEVVKQVVILSDAKSSNETF